MPLNNFSIYSSLFLNNIIPSKILLEKMHFSGEICGSRFKRLFVKRFLVPKWSLQINQESFVSQSSNLSLAGSATHPSTSEHRHPACHLKLTLTLLPRYSLQVPSGDSVSFPGVGFLHWHFYQDSTPRGKCSRNRIVLLTHLLHSCQ